MDINRLKEIIREEIYNTLTEVNEFEVGQKVTYLGHPAVVTATKEYNGRNFVSVSYDKGTGKTKASDILATSGDVKAINENDSYVRVSEPKFIKDKNNPNFLYVNFKYDTGGGVLTALGKETMSGQIRRLSSAEAMKKATSLAKDLEAKYNLEDIDVYDKENGVVQIFAVSDDFIDMDPNMLGKSVNEVKTYKKGDKLKIKLKNGKKFDVIFDVYANQKEVAFGKFKDGSGEYDTKPFSLDSIVVNEAIKNDVKDAEKSAKKDSTAKKLSSTPDDKKEKFNLGLKFIKKYKDDKPKIDAYLKKAKEEYKLSTSMLKDLKRAAGRDVKS